VSSPTLIPIGLYDTIESQIIGLLKAFNTEQSPLQNPPGSSQFAVVQQFHIFDPVLVNPALANVYCALVEPQPEKSGAYRAIAEKATYYLDLYAKGTEQQGVQAASANAHQVLKYLAQQVCWCLVRLANVDFGLGPGYISNRPYPRFELTRDETTKNEPQIVTGRITLEVEYGWIPEDLNSTNLTEVFVTILGLQGTDETPHTESQVQADFPGLG
jgi:hypothetical protein